MKKYREELGCGSLILITIIVIAFWAIVLSLFWWVVGDYVVELYEALLYYLRNQG